MIKTLVLLHHTLVKTAGQGKSTIHYSTAGLLKTVQLCRTGIGKNSVESTQSGRIKKGRKKKRAKERKTPAEQGHGD